MNPRKDFLWHNFRIRLSDHEVVSSSAYSLYHQSSTRCLDGGSGPLSRNALLRKHRRDSGPVRILSLEQFKRIFPSTCCSEFSGDLLTRAGPYPHFFKTSVPSERKWRYPSTYHRGSRHRKPIDIRNQKSIGLVTYHATEIVRPLHPYRPSGSEVLSVFPKDHVVHFPSPRSRMKTEL
ncbi:hypothetical protein GGQ68_002740 [Sagittula marina]|uniref:Uncharacterized protein n=1 Tax=Sagittula marina TaxID=943940 RepID=A0A7W6GSF6_9RHOB|nr:hypothetical protein [Sagittula marina]